MKNNVVELFEYILFFFICFFFYLTFLCYIYLLRQMSVLSLFLMALLNITDTVHCTYLKNTI